MTARPRKREGFILLTVLWVVAILALVLAIVSDWTARGLGAATHLADRRDAERLVYETEQEAIFRLLTSHYSARGIELGQLTATRDLNSPDPFGAVVQGTAYIAVDDRPYLGDEGTILRIQDARGLASIGPPNDETMIELLGQCGLSRQDGQALLDKLLDYQDPGDLRRVNGASDADYIEIGRPLPRHAFPITPYEIRRVLGWDSAGSCVSRMMPESFTVYQTAGIDFATATKPFLLTVPGMTPQRIDDLLAFRQDHSIINPADLAEALHGIAGIDDMTVFYFPADGFRVDITPANGTFTERLELHLSPQETNPWHVDYLIELPAAGPPRESGLPQPLPRPAGPTPLSADAQ